MARMPACLSSTEMLNGQVAAQHFLLRFHRMGLDTIGRHELGVAEHSCLVVDLAGDALACRRVKLPDLDVVMFPLFGRAPDGVREKCSLHRSTLTARRRSSASQIPVLARSL